MKRSALKRLSAELSLLEAWLGGRRAAAAGELSGESLLEIGDDVVGVFDADRQPQ